LAADRSRGPTYDIGQLDRPPRPTSQPRPAYPAELRKAGLSGEVQVEFIVDAQGAVREAIAVNSTWREFESAAIEAVSKWRFVPGQKDGRPVGARLRMPIVFRLSDGAGTPAADQGKKPGQPNWF
jgi:protein TonB